MVWDRVGSDGCLRALWGQEHLTMPITFTPTSTSSSDTSISRLGTLKSSIRPSDDIHRPSHKLPALVRDHALTLANRNKSSEVVNQASSATPRGQDQQPRGQREFSHSISSDSSARRQSSGRFANFSQFSNDIIEQSGRILVQAVKNVLQWEVIGLQTALVGKLHILVEVWRAFKKNTLLCCPCVEGKSCGAP